ncbi:hypothetical protein FACS1894159_03540 [Bacteroidia bacterium]|nr:hypothetical protein FACS1894159_03540 [Bacteroidia bacterium]
MRHNKKFNHLGRQSAHRKALMSNMATSLIIHKRISTTVAKAKALKMYVEPLITRSKEDTTHSRRTVFSYLKDKHATAELFREVAPKVAGRPGGYTRILKTGFRLGDAADMCIIELVDFNESYTSAAAPKAKTRRSRSGKGAEGKAAAGATTTLTDAAATTAAPKAKAAEVAAAPASEAEEAIPAAEAQPELEAAPAVEELPAAEAAPEVAPEAAAAEEPKAE